MSTASARASGGPSLGARLLLLCALLVLLSTGGAILATILLGRPVSERSIDEALTRSQTVQSRFLRSRFEQLELISRVFASDPAVVSFVQESIDSGSVVSLLDLLAEYQQDLGFDFAVVLDHEGVIVARTDQPDADAELFSGVGLVDRAFEEGRASGIWLDGAELFTAVAVPITQQFDLIGYLITGYRIDEELARDLARVSSAEITYLSDSPGGLSLAATTLSPEEGRELVQQLRRTGGLQQWLERDDDLELAIRDEPWRGLLVPLRDVDDEIVGASLSLTSVRARTAGFRRLLATLIGVGVVAVLAAIAASVALSRRLARPIRELAAATEAASEGNYDQPIEVRGGGEVAVLGDSVRRLLSDLREKRDMETFLAQLSRTLPEQEVSVSARQAPEAVELAVLAVEMRKLASPLRARDPADALEVLSRDLRRIQTCLVERGGRWEGLCGHRVVASFAQPGAPVRALRAATVLVDQLAEGDRNASAPAVAVAFGTVVRGSAPLGDRLESSLTGLPVQQLDGLLREASAGDIVLSPRARRECETVIETHGVALREQPSLLTGQSLSFVDAGVRKVLRETDSEERDETLGVTDDGAGLNRQTLSEIGPGSLLGNRYEVVSILGSGGMGVVFRVWDRELSDFVALKMLRPEGWRRTEDLERLKEELRLARSITHPNVLRTFDFGEVDGRPFITMEYVRGMTLRYLLDETGGIPQSAATRLLRQVCAGLQAAHAASVLHGDIKPENVILDSTGTAKLMDFGIARPVRGKGADNRSLMGTPHYLAPEQISAGRVDQRADIYAVGVVAYEIFTGNPPFDAGTTVELLQRHLEDEPVPPSRLVKDFPEWLEKAILRCLEKDPEKRFQTAGDLAEALEAPLRRG